jgi:hypothetical protein
MDRETEEQWLPSLFCHRIHTRGPFHTSLHGHIQLSVSRPLYACARLRPSICRSFIFGPHNQIARCTLKCHLLVLAIRGLAPTISLPFYRELRGPGVGTGAGREGWWQNHAIDDIFHAFILFAYLVPEDYYSRGV